MGIDVADFDNSGIAGIAITNFDNEMIGSVPFIFGRRLRGRCHEDRCRAGIAK